MPKVEILCGPPLSGKSTYALMKYLNLMDQSWEILSRDDIRLELSKGKYKFDPKTENLVTKIFNSRFAAFTSIYFKFNIIIDNTNTNPKYIREYIKKLPEDYTWEIKFFDISLWKAYYRNVIRYLFDGEKKWIPFKVIRKFKKEYDKFKKDYESGKIKF